MKMLDIISARKENDDSIVLAIKDPLTGSIKTKHCADIRVGIHWPTPISPAYFVAVSQDYTGAHEHNKGDQAEGQRQVIAEFVSESIGMKELYSELIIFIKKSLCNRLYADLPEDRYDFGHLQDLEDYARKNECGIYVHNANDENDFFLSVSRIRDNFESDMLIIPENTAVFDQLSFITREDLLDTPEERFYCIDALGHVLDGYYRNPPRNYPLVTRRRKPPDWRYN